jgi:hypothetical protein
MFNNSFVDQHRFDYSEPSKNEGDVDEIIPRVPKFKDVFGSVLLFHMIGHLVIDVCHERLIWRLVKHLIVKIN